MKEDGTISKRGYCMAHFSKFVRPGYIRIGATENPANGVSVSAFKGDGEVVVVAVNHSLNTYGQNFKLTDSGELKSIKAYTTTMQENLAETENIVFDGERFAYVLPPESVTTFIISVE